MARSPVASTPGFVAQRGLWPRGTLTSALFRREREAGGHRLRMSLPDLHFEEPAGDRAVHERHAVRWPQPELAGGRGVGREDRRPPAAALLHEPVAEPAEERARSRQREPLAIRRIRDHETGRCLRPHLLEVMLCDHDARLHARGHRTRPSRLDRAGIEVAGRERACRLSDVSFEFRDEPLHQGLVTVAKPKEPVCLPPRPPEPGSHARGDRRCLDHERARPAHRIEQWLAGGWLVSHTGPPPAGDREDARREYFRERRLHLTHPPPTLVERTPGRIAENRGHVTDEMQRQPQCRPAQLHARPLPARGAQLVHDRVLHDLRRIERVGGERVVDRRINAKRVGRLQLLRPVHLLHRAIEALRRVDAKPAQRLEDPDRRAALEHGPIERLLLPAGWRRKLDRAPADPQVGDPEGLKLARQNPLEPFERARRQPRRLVDERRGEWPRRRRHGGKSGSRHEESTLPPVT